MSLSEQPQDKIAYTLRFLNTVLAGCEYSITKNTVKFVVDRPEVIDTLSESADPDDNVIFVPDGAYCTQFSLTADMNGILISGQAGTQTCSSYEKQNLDKVEFVLRPADEEWDETKIISKPVDAKPEKKSKDDKRKFKWILPVSLVTSIFAGVVFLALYNTDSARSEKLYSSIGKAPGRYFITAGLDNNQYILTENDITATWIKQALLKSNQVRKAEVLSRKDMESSIENKLRNTQPELRYHGIRFENNNNDAVIILSSERSGKLSQQTLNSFTAMLKSQLKWLGKVDYKFLSDAIVQGYAENGFKSIIKDYNVTKNSDYVMLSVSGELPDNVIYELKHFIEQFQTEWKGNYVQFSINLESDWLKGRSFQYGKNGYVKMSPGHWYFTNPNKGEN